MKNEENDFRESYKLEKQTFYESCTFEVLYSYIFCSCKKILY